jgi:hypothetical protein
MRNISTGWDDIEVKILPEDDDTSPVLKNVGGNRRGSAILHIGIIMTAVGSSNRRRHLAKEIQHVLETNRVEIDRMHALVGEGSHLAIGEEAIGEKRQ